MSCTWSCLMPTCHTLIMIELCCNIFFLIGGLLCSLCPCFWRWCDINRLFLSISLTCNNRRRRWTLQRLTVHFSRVQSRGEVELKENLQLEESPAVRSCVGAQHSLLQKHKDTPSFVCGIWILFWRCLAELSVWTSISHSPHAHRA